MTSQNLAQKSAKLAGRALVLLAGVAGWLSYASVRSVAVGVFGLVGGSAFPILLDTGVFVASEFYLASVRNNRPQAGFRLLAHALIGLTIALNVSAAADWRAVLFHSVPPIVFASLVELRARKELRDVRAEMEQVDRIPIRLWLTSPIESFKLALWAARDTSFSEVRAARERYLIARRALRIAVPGWHGTPRTARALVRRQLRTGTLDPSDLVAATGLDAEVAEPGAKAVLTVALVAALSASGRQGANASRSASRTASRMRISGASGAGRGAIILPSARRSRSASEMQGSDEPDPLADKALELDQANIALGGGPISMRSLQRQLSVGQQRATDLRAWLDEQPAPVTHANGSI